jgi:hypothetical protein
MELFLFIVFVAACALLLFRATSRSKNKISAKQERKLKEREARTQLLETPAVYTLSRPGQPGHTRRDPATLGVSRTNRFSPKSRSTDPEYDGYSRRDRHHVTDLNAQVKDEAHIEDSTASANGRWGGTRLAH